jgi:WD40 repeat protein/MoxR-like ATPase
MGDAMGLRQALPALESDPADPAARAGLAPLVMSLETQGLTPETASAANAASAIVQAKAMAEAQAQALIVCAAAAQRGQADLPEVAAKLDRLQASLGDYLSPDAKNSVRSAHAEARSKLSAAQQRKIDSLLRRIAGELKGATLVEALAVESGAAQRSAGQPIPSLGKPADSVASLLHEASSLLAQAPSAAQAESAETDSPLSSETLQALRTLGLTLPQFRRLVHAQTAFKRDLLAEHPELAQAFFSQRDQERFSKAVLSLTQRRRDQGSDRPLAEALILAGQSFYGDVLSSASGWNLFKRGKQDEPRRLMSRFSEFIDEDAWAHIQSESLESRLLGIPVGDSTLERRTARALLTNDSALFQEPPGSDAEFMGVLRRQARALGASLGILYSHPFTEDRQLLGHDVPLEDGRLAFGLGELTRRIRAAQAESEQARLEGRPARKHLLLIKNVEALEPGVRTLLQSALADREITHPVLGQLPIPDNLQFLFTIRKDANIEDDSFYDRVALRTLPTIPSYRDPPGLQWPDGVDAGNYLDSIGLRQDEGRPVLLLPGAEIPLSDAFAGITPQNLHDEIYLKTGLVLDFQTVRMLAMMAQVQARGGLLLRLEGPTGLGKTFAARGYARLRGRPFFSNPVSEDTQLSDLIGGFEQDEAGRFRFHGETPLKQRLEEGGVAALSELNTLLDHDQKAALGWWLCQIAEAEPQKTSDAALPAGMRVPQAEPDAQGYRTIALTEVPVPAGLPVPVIRIHPRTLIVVDTNPEGEYAARGALPDVLKERVPILSAEPLVTAGARASRKRGEIDTLRRDADMFLKHDWTFGGRVLGPGLADAGLRGRLAKRLAEIYWEASSLTQSWQDPGGRVLSMRELRRMAEDVLAGLAAGKSEEAALGEAAAAHLGGWLTAPKQIEALRRKLSAVIGPLPPLKAQAALADQLLAKARPTHLRLPAGADAREALRLLAQDPSVELSLVHATEETDRFQMEGGLVPSESGTGLIFGPGIFARMIEQAEASPDKTVVYVFDNAHNIKPEQVVALNEFLQDGFLYPKGARKPMSMPANARVLFISRRDSTPAWSPAERSRFVELAEGEDDAWASRSAAQELGQALSALPEQLADFMSRWAAGLYARLREAEPNAPAGTFSESSFRCFLRAAAAAALATADAGLGVQELALRLETAALDNLVSWAAPQRFQALAALIPKGLDLMVQGYGSLRLGRGQPALAQGLSSFEQARADFSIAATPDERAKALAALRRVIETQSANLPWQEKPASELAPLDVGRALALLPQDFGISYIISTAITPDGQTLAVGSENGTARVFRFSPDQGRYVEVGSALQHDGWVKSVALTSDGRALVTGSGFDDAKVRVFRLDPKQDQYVLAGHPITDGSAVASAAITPDGQTLAVGTDASCVSVFHFDPKQDKYVKIGPALKSDGPILATALTPDAKTIALGSRDGKARVFRFDAQQNKYVQAGPALKHDGMVFSAALTSDGNTLATGEEGMKARIFRFDQKQNKYVQAGPSLEHDNHVRSIALARDGKTLVTGSEKKIRVFRFDASQNQYVPAGSASEHSDWISSLAITPDAATLIVGGGKTLSVYSLRPFIVQDDASVVLMDGRRAPRSGLAGPVEAAVKPEQSWTQALPQAQADFAIAATPADRAKALDSLRRIIETGSARMPWQEKPASELRPLDVGRALALLPQDFPTASMRSVAITSDGQTFVAGSLDGKARVFRFDPKQGKYVQAGPALEHGGWVLSAALTPDGKTLVTGGKDKKVRIFRFYPGENRYIQAGPELEHGDWIYSVAITPDGKTLATGCRDNKARVFRLDERTGRYIQAGPALEHEGGVKCAALASDGQTLATGSSDKKARIFRFDPTRNKYVQAGPALEQDGIVYCVALTPEGQTLVTGNEDGKARVFRFDADTERYVQLGPALEQDGAVYSAAITPDGRTLVTGSADKKVRVFLLAPGRNKYAQAGPAFKHDGLVIAAAITPDARTLLVGGEGGLQAYASAPFIVQDDAAALMLDDRSIPLQNLTGPVFAVTAPQRPWTQALPQAQADFGIAATPAEKAKALAALRRLLETQSARMPWQEKPESELRALDVGRALALLPQDFPTSEVHSAAITPDGETLAVGSLDNKARVFRLDHDRNQYVQVGPEIEHDDSVTAVALASDGQTLVTGSEDKKARVFRLDSGKNKYVQAGSAIEHDDWVLSAALTPDGKTLATGGRDGTIRVFRLDSKQDEHVQAGPALKHHGHIYSMAITPDGQTLAAGADDLRVFRFDSVQDRYAQAGSAIAHDGVIMSIALTPDARTLVTGCGDKKAHVFRFDSVKNKYVKAGRALEHADWVNALALTPDGKILVTGSGKKTRIFRFDSDKNKYAASGPALEHACTVRSLAITPEGRTMLVGGLQGLQIYSPQSFIVQDDASVVLMDGRRSPRDRLAGPIAVIAEPERPWAQALPQAQADFAIAASPAERAKALAALRRVIETQSSLIPWKETPAAGLRALDVGRALALLPQDFPASSVLSAAITPDKTIIVTGGSDNKARVFRFDADTDRYVPLGPALEHDGAVYSASITPDGLTLLTGSTDKNARVFRFDPGRNRYVQSGPALEHGDWVYSTAITPDGRTLVTGSGDKKARVFRFDPGRNEYAATDAVFDHGGTVYSAAITPDGRTLVTGSMDNKARAFRFDALKNKYVQTGPALEHDGPVYSVALTPDGDTFAAGCRDGKARIFRFKPGLNRYVQDEPALDNGHEITSVALTPDGRTLAASGSDGEVRVFRFDPRRNEHVQAGSALKYGGSVYSTAISPDAKTLLVGGLHGLEVYSLQSFIVQDDASSVLLDGRSIPRRSVAGAVFAADEPEDVRAVAEPPPAPFAPRYGAKPFYFAADEDGRVWLNFKGRRLLTRHALIAPLERLGERPREQVSSPGRRRTFFALRLSDIQDPYAEAPRPLSEDDFLMETPMLERVEGMALEDWSRGRAVNFVGPSGGGKTSIARELGLLLGLPRFVFQMHGERELSDLLGAFREDPEGRLVLTARPTRDARGRLRFKLPLLDMIANGGLFVLDEGAIGERGRELLSWFSGLAAGDREIVLQEFPGFALRLPVHKEFGLVVTNNSPEDTPGRLQPKSEITANVHSIHVPDDDEPAVLEGIFKHFLGQNAPADPRDAERWGKAAAALHHLLKPSIGKKIGKDNSERYYLSKREVRRVAVQLRRALAADPRCDADRAFARALREVYEAMFSHRDERAFVRKRIEEVLKRPLDAAGLRAELAARMPLAATEDEAWVEGLTQDLLSRGEPVLHIAEAGARTSDMARAAAQAMGARLEPVDAAPEQGALELLGGWLPHLGDRPAGAARSRQVRGRLTRYLLTRSELDALGRGGGQGERVVLWLRNVDQWSEEIRTALNGLLEDGFIDIEGVDGRVVRLYKPPTLHLLAEMPADSTRDFSSAFFSRWVKIGISQDSVKPESAGGPSEFQRVLRSRFALDALDAHWTAQLRAALSHFDEDRRWANRGAHQYQAGIFFSLAQALKEARKEDPRWAALLDRTAAEGCDPRADPWTRPAAHRALFDDYRSLASELFAREARRLVAARLSAQSPNDEISDAQRFEDALEAVLGRRVPQESPTLATDDATPEGRLAFADGVPVRASAQAEGLRSAARACRVFLSPQIARALGMLARADRLGLAAAFGGETGSVKTSVCALWARLTGRRFYKYQAHGGSETSDLTIDFEQEASGTFRKRVKDFYRLLREGRVVIDIDEANLAPWMLWTLEPLLRGEREVHPIFPDEPPFLVGDGVQIVMTFNPTRYSGRQAIDPRLLQNSLTAWMDLASPQELEKVAASFYGVWEQPVESARGAAAEVLAAPPLTAGEAPESSKAIDDFMREGQETFSENSPPAAGRRPGEGAQSAHGVFTPELFPYTRLSAYDAYDEVSGQWKRRGELAAEDVPRLTPGQADALARELSASNDLFEGRVRMTLGKQWQSLPSAGPGMRFIELAAFDASGRPADPGIELARDSADNCYVRARQAADVELRYRVAVPAFSFGRPVPAGLPFRYPAQIPAEVRQALQTIGLKGDEADFRAVLHALAAYFRDFSLKTDGIVRHGGSAYLDIVLSKCGVCRHRAFAFARTALGLGIPARYVESDIHAWAEVRVPNLGWMRVDLGGGGDPMNMDLSPLAGERHSPRFNDGLPTPKAYLENGRRMAERTLEAMKQQGLKPPHAGSGQTGPGGQSGSPGGQGGSSGQEGKGAGSSGGAAADSRRIQAELGGLDARLSEDAQIHDELAPLFASGKGDTQFVFDRMLRALRDAVRIEKLHARSGLEIDPQALIQRRPKPFIRRKKQEKLRTTADCVVLDFSGSMGAVKQQLAYTIGAVGENFWKLREAAPEHFYYDLSSFADAPQTYVAMGARLSQKENAERIVGMANDAGRQGGTNIVGSLRSKLADFMASRQARGAKVKNMLLVTDGADAKSIVQYPDGRWRPTQEMAAVLAQFAEAGIDVTFIGIGPAAEQVKALDGPRRHYVRIDAARSEDIAEAVAKLAELTGRGAPLPDGELNALMQITPP